MSTPQQKELRLATGSANWGVLYCPICPPGALANEHKAHPVYWWAEQLGCSNCNSKWVVCRECSKVRHHLTDQQQVSRHNKNHKQPPSQSSTPAKRPRLELPPPSPSNPPTPLREPPPPELMPPQKIKITIPEDTMLRAQSRTFFEADCNGNGLAYLACLANFHRTDVADEVLQNEVTRFINVAAFAGTLTRPQREEFAYILRDVVSAKPKEADTLWRIPVPTTPQELRRTIMEGKYSVFENLPHPLVQEVGDYAYCLPSDCLSDLLAHGFANLHPTLPKFNKQSTITQGLGSSPAAKRILASRPGESPSFLFLGFWSDGFEPTNSKQNRASAWIKTMSVHTEDPANSFVPITHVYPVAVGPKGNDHDVVERLLRADVDRLEHNSAEVYDGKERKMTTIMAHQIVVLQDQPERRAFVRLMLGNSTYHAQFGVSFDFSQCINVMRPCTQCLQDMENTIADDDWTPPHCDACTNWAINPEHPLLVFKSPKDFPEQETLRDKPGYLPYKKLNFNGLKSAVGKAHGNIMTKTWTTAQAMSYLRVQCLNSVALDAIKKCAENCRMYEQAQEARDNDLLAALEEEIRLSPDSYTRWKYPVSWDLGLHMWHFPEVSMHLWKGIVSSFLGTTHTYVRKEKKFAAYLRVIKPMTEAVKALHLSWLPVEPYTSAKLGGWVSENYFGYARIMTWTMSSVRGMQRDAPYLPPDKPQTKWTKAENSAWLAARRLDTTGNALELRQRVAEFLALPVPPPIPPPSGGPVECLEAATVSLYHIVAYMMHMGSITKSSENVTSRLVRLYLTRLYDLDENL